MSVNISSPPNSLQLYNCATDIVSLYVSTSITALRILLLLPLSTFILYLGHHRWQQQSSSKTATHSDIFTYNVAAMELIGVLGSFCYFGGSYTNYFPMTAAGVCVSLIVFCGESFFHVLSCVERYLAVVHPITYLGLRNARGVRIRNICIGCVWLLSFGLMSVTAGMLPNYTPYPLLCVFFFSIIVISFCSLSVLCVLIRPGPGDGGGEKGRVDQSKQRAFYTITVISVTVWLGLVGLLVPTAVNVSPLLENSVGCLLAMMVGWLSLPSGLVSPLLYLHRLGKLSCCSGCLHVTNNSKDGC